MCLLQRQPQQSKSNGAKGRAVFWRAQNAHVAQNVFNHPVLCLLLLLHSIPNLRQQFQSNSEGEEGGGIAATGPNR